MDEGEKWLWGKGAALLFRIGLQGSSEKMNREFAFLQYMDCLKSLLEMDKSLVCLHPSWTTNEENYQIGLCGIQDGEVEEGDWRRTEPFSSIGGCINAVQSNNSISKQSFQITRALGKAYILH